MTPRDDDEYVEHHERWSSRRRNETSGCGCIGLFLLSPFLLSLLGVAVVVPGLVLASPAVVAYLLVAERDQLAAYPSWWIGVALAPVVAYLVVWLAARTKVHPQHRTRLNRAGLLTGVCTAAALLALVLDLIYLDGKVPGRPADPEATTLPAAATAGAVLAALLFYAALKWLDRKVPNRPRVARVVTAPRLDPQPREIWWGEVEFRDGDGAKDRPVVILRALPSHLEIVQITSQDKSHRRDHIPFWTDSSDPDAVDGGCVELRVRELSRFDLRCRDPATCPDEIWSRVRSMKLADPA